MIRFPMALHRDENLIEHNFVVVSPVALHRDHGFADAARVEAWSRDGRGLLGRVNTPHIIRFFHVIWGGHLRLLQLSRSAGSDGVVGCAGGSDENSSSDSNSGQMGGSHGILHVRVGYRKGGYI